MIEPKPLPSVRVPETEPRRLIENPAKPLCDTLSSILTPGARDDNNKNAFMIALSNQLKEGEALDIAPSEIVDGVRRVAITLNGKQVDLYSLAINPSKIENPAEIDNPNSDHLVILYSALASEVERLRGIPVNERPVLYFDQITTSLDAIHELYISTGDPELKKLVNENGKMINEWRIEALGGGKNTQPELDQLKAELDFEKSRNNDLLNNQKAASAEIIELRRKLIQLQTDGRPQDAEKIVALKAQIEKLQAQQLKTVEPARLAEMKLRPQTDNNELSVSPAVRDILTKPENREGLLKITQVFKDIFAAKDESVLKNLLSCPPEQMDIQLVNLIAAHDPTLRGVAETTIGALWKAIEKSERLNTLTQIMKALEHTVQQGNLKQIETENF